MPRTRHVFPPPFQHSVLFSAASVFAFGLAALPGRAAGQESSVYDFVPASSLVTLRGLPDRAGAAGTSRPATSQPTVADLLGLLDTTGLLRGGTQALADLAGCLPLLARHEFALTLLRIDVQPMAAGETHTASLRLAELECVLVVRTGGRADEFYAAVSRLVRRYTNTDLATLESIGPAAARHQRLRDSRLPGWAVWEWGLVGDYFVAALGDGAFAKAAAAAGRRDATLSNDEWHHRARRAASFPGCLYELTLDVPGLRTATGGGSARLMAVLGALGEDRLERDFWAAGVAEPRWVVKRFSRRDRRDVGRAFADDNHAAPASAALRSASRFAVVRLADGFWREALPAAYMASRTPRQAAVIRRFWSETAKAAGRDVAADLRTGLFDELWIFNYPPHPLRLPIALTLAVPVRDPAQTRAALDATLSAWTDRRSAKESDSVWSVKVQRGDDGVWFLRAGLLGPALMVSDGFLVLSWAPQAAREAAAALDARPSSAPAK